MHQRGRNWHARFGEVRRLPDGSTVYIQHRESTRSEDEEFARRDLDCRLSEVGGHRAFIEPEWHGPLRVIPH
jgi:hypothetical protein